jgi:hypothetical protein
VRSLLSALRRQTARSRIYGAAIGAGAPIPIRVDVVGTAIGDGAPGAARVERPLHRQHHADGSKKGVSAGADSDIHAIGNARIGDHGADKEDIGHRPVPQSLRKLQRGDHSGDTDAEIQARQHIGQAHIAQKRRADHDGQHPGRQKP